MDENNNITDRIKVILFGPKSGPIKISPSYNGLKYVEQLLLRLLDEQKVGPIYSTLFAFKHVKWGLWLPPNYRIKDLLNKGRKKKESNIILELRMRFRPSILSNMRARDVNAFNVMFAQVRYDFIHTKFNDEKKDFVLLDPSVLSLIAHDLIRYAIENELQIDKLFERINPNDFIPHKAAKMQRRLLFRLKEKFQIQKSVELGLEKFQTPDDVLGVKLGFMKLFLSEVCKDYCSETYKVQCNDEPEEPVPMKLKIKFEAERHETNCVVLGQFVSVSKSKSKDVHDWIKICDIFSIDNVTFLRDKGIEISRSNSTPFRASFESDTHAKSFLSSINGYFRLMRKWYFNVCRDVVSPDLEMLRSMNCHGPIGPENSRIKLMDSRQPGDFLVRRSMEHLHQYQIDVLLKPATTRLCMTLEYDSNEKTFRVLDYGTSGAKNIDVLVDKDTERVSLKNLIKNVQIILDKHNPKDEPPLQLKKWIAPTEFDDHPTLLLSLSLSKLQYLMNRIMNTGSVLLDDLPKLIPEDMILYENRQPIRTGNKHQVAFGKLAGKESLVIVKKYIGIKPFKVAEGELMFLSAYKGKGSSDKSDQPKGPQLQLIEWIFVKGSNFAETIGSIAPDSALVQEYLPLGPLDVFLQSEESPTDELRLSIACQLSAALLYLMDQRICHGKIRCRNLYIKNFQPFRIKITDPLGTINIEKDQAFLAPEYSSVDIGGLIELPSYDCSIDVWASGTTMWQVYNDGCQPPFGVFANTLIKPHRCPDSIWSIIETCWAINPSLRATPQSLHRDFNDAVARQKLVHHYDDVCQENTQSNSHDPAGKPAAITATDTSQKVASSGANGLINADSGSDITLLYQRRSQVNNTTNHAQTLNTKHQNGGHQSNVEKKSAFQRKWEQFKTTLSRSTNGVQRDDIVEDNQDGSSVTNLSICSSGSELTDLTDLPYSSSDASRQLERYIWQVDSNQIKLGQEIGRGSCGRVLKGSMTSDGKDERVVAVKCINTDTGDTLMQDDLRNEFLILKSLKHPNILETFGFAHKTHLVLVVEYMPLGSLATKLRNSRGDHLHSLPLRKYALDIARGMEYLESMRIVHRDLALRNILVKSHNEVKICDFGLARRLKPNEDYYTTKTDRALPLKWYAPETLANWTFSHKSDVWSYGVVLWEIYSGGSEPYYSGGFAQLKETLKHERLMKPSGCPEEMYQLMLYCWTYNPNDRYSFKQICNDLNVDLDYEQPSLLQQKHHEHPQHHQKQAQLLPPQSPCLTNGSPFKPTKDFNQIDDDKTTNGLFNGFVRASNC